MTESTIKSSAEVVGVVEEVPIRVLHVDDESGFLKVAKQCLETQGLLQVETASSVEEAMEKLEEKDFDAIVSDYVMPGKDGLEFLKELRHSGNNIPFIIFTGKGREEVAIKALNLGADRYFNKVGDPEAVYGELAHGIRQSVERKRYEERLSALNTYSQKLNMAGSMEEIYELALDAAEKTLGFEFADILMIEGKMLCLVTHRGPSTNLSLKLPLDGDKGITVRAARTGKPVFVPDISKEKAYVEGGLEMRSELAVPIKIGDKILGVLNVENKKLDAFNEKDQELLEILASHAATAISNLEHAENLEIYAREIRESQEKSERLFRSNPEAAVYVDSDFHVLDANSRFSQLFGYSLDEIKGKGLFDLIVPEDKKEEGEMLDREAKKAYTHHDTFRKRKDGALIPVSISAAPIIVEGQPIGYVGLYKDITERKRFEERLSALNIYSRSLNLAGSMEEIYRVTLDAMEKTLGFEHAFFMVVDKDMLCVVDQRGYPVDLSIRLPLDGSKGGVSVKVARTGKPINVPDVEKEDAWVVFWSGIRSGLDVPVKIGRKVLGVIGVDSKSLNAFDEKDQKLLEILASHAATAMSNLEHAKNLKAYAQEIRESKEKFERLFMDNPEAAVYLDPDFHILDANPRFSELFRYSLNKIKGKNIDDVVVPKDKTEEAEMLNKKAEEGYVYHNTVRKKKDGTLVPVSISAAPITVEGKIIGTVGLYRDITERKRFEERLSALNIYSRSLNLAGSMEEIYQVTLDAMEKTLGFENAAFMIVDKNMLYTVDQRGYPEILSFKLPLDGAKKGITIKAVKTGRPVLVPDTKKERDYVVGMPGMRSELDVPVKIGNKVLGVLSVESERLNAFDEKDQKLLEILASHAATAMSNLEHAKNLEAYAREIRESQEKFEGLFMGNPEATVYVDQDSHILDVNPRFEELFGYSLDEVKGEYLDNVVVPRDKMEEGKMLQEKALKGHFYYDTVRKRKDGFLVPVSISVAPITVGGKLVGTVGLYKDISQLRKAEKTLRNTLEKLEIVNEKLRVVGRLTRHDVRNKLAAVTGNVYLAKKRLPADHENMDQLVEIESAVRQVEKIFDFARTYERLGVEELVYMGVEKDVEGAVALFSDLQGVKVVNDCRGLTVLADSLLRQLLYNLIDNSLKYGEKISQIRVYYEEADENGLKLVYEDDGVGIPKAEKEKIFKEGYGKGTGYGLYLIRKICEVYGWTIKETGKQGIGARFTITIPKMNESGKTAYRLY